MDDPTNLASTEIPFEVLELMQREKYEKLEGPSHLLDGTPDDLPSFRSSLEHAEKWREAIKRVQTLTFKDGPDDRPFHFLYLARAILKELRDKLVAFGNSDNQDETFPKSDIYAAIANVDLYLGMNYLESEETHLGADALRDALNFFVNLVEADKGSAEVEVDPKRAKMRQSIRELSSDAARQFPPPHIMVRYATVLQETYNQLAVLWSHREEYEVSYVFLKLAERIYEEMRHLKQERKSEQKDDGEVVADDKILLEDTTMPLFDFLMHAKIDVTDEKQDDPTEPKPASQSVLLLPEKAWKPIKYKTTNARGTVLLANQRDKDAASHSIFTLSIYYLAQVCGHMKKADEGAKYCTVCMKLQMESGDYEELDYTLNCLQMSSFYMSEGDLIQSHEYLMMAEKVMPEPIVIAPDTAATAQRHDRSEKVARARANMERTWGNFYLTALRMTRDAYNRRLEGHETQTEQSSTSSTDAPKSSSASEAEEANNEHTEQADRIIAEHKESQAKLQQVMDADRSKQIEQHKQRLNEKLSKRGGPNSPTGEDGDQAFSSTSSAHEWTSDRLVDQLTGDAKHGTGEWVFSDFDGARELFKKGLGHFTNSLKTFVLDGYVTDHVDVLLDICALYKNLAQLETDPDRRAKMHRHRINQIEPIVLEVNEKFYNDLVRHMHYDLAESYQQIFEDKLLMRQYPERYKEVKGLSVPKTNETLLDAIKWYSMFVASFRNQETRQDPSKDVDDAYIRPYLMARFMLARCRTRLLTNEASVMIESHRRALEEYKSLLEYLELSTCPKSREEFSEEHQMVKELVELLPLKIGKMEVLRHKGGPNAVMPLS